MPQVFDRIIQEMDLIYNKPPNDQGIDWENPKDKINDAIKSFLFPMIVLLHSCFNDSDKIEYINDTINTYNLIIQNILTVNEDISLTQVDTIDGRLILKSNVDRQTISERCAHDCIEDELNFWSPMFIDETKESCNNPNSVTCHQDLFVKECTCMPCHIFIDNVTEKQSCFQSDILP